MIPFVDLDEISLEEAVEYLEAQSRILDPEIIEENKGVGFVLNMGSGNSPEVELILQKRFSLRLRNVPLRQVLNYVTQQAGTTYRVDPFAIVIQPANGVTDDLVVRRYKVPPNFLDQAAGGPSGDEDPFETSNEQGSRLAPRLTAQEFLEAQGVPFPSGASANFNSGIGQLIVKTTSTGHDFVRTLVDTVNLTQPIAVIIETKIVRIDQENLEELSFDATLQSLAANGDLVLGGGTLGNGRQSDFTGSITRPGDFPLPFGAQPLTSGLRSGDFAVTGDAIEAVQNEVQRVVPSTVTGLFGSVQDPGGAATTPISSAPGILSLVGLVNDQGLSVLLRGLDQKTGTDLISQPSVVTRSGQQAIIEIGQEFIYPTEYEPPEIPNSIGTSTLIDVAAGEVFSPTSFFASPSHPTAFETRTLGTVLEVQPTVSADRRTTELSFNLQMDEFLGFINYGEPILGGSTQGAFGAAGILATGQSGEVTSNDILQPLFDSVRLNTNLEIATNQTIIVGGLLNEVVEDVEDKVPILGDLPFVGKFFTSDVFLRRKSVVMVFVTVRIVDPGGNPVQN